ncbi:hypothetical protein [Ruegeria atlantica]|uniref:hypothetical protein n=1 Tax=Ruegeria atlantica TaxID=81569 RepID=UPI00147E1393|nr:hypothetical protein [Ruegeria atlantica]
MGKFRNRLSASLGCGVAFAASLTPAVGQQSPIPQPPIQQTTAQTTAATQTPLQQSTAQSTVVQQTPSQQLIAQQALQNPARQVGSPTIVQSAGTGSDLIVTLDYLSSLRHDNNLRLTDPSLGSTTWWENELALNILKQANDSTLAIDLSGLYRIANEPIIGTESSFSDPSAQLAYQRTRLNSSLDLLLDYTERDLAFNRSLTDTNLDGIIDSADVLGTAGDQINTLANLSWAVGLNAPVGFQFDYSHRERRYKDTFDPSLIENRSDIFDSALLFQISPVLQGNLSVGYEDFTAEDNVRTETQTTTVSAGGAYNLSSTTFVSLDAGYSQVDDTQRATNTSNTTESFVWNFAWNKALSDGNADVRINQTFGVNGTRLNATAGRNYQLTNGTLNFDIGFTRGPFDEITPIGQLNYSYRLLSSRIGATIQRRVGTSTDSLETRQTLAFLTYDYFINPVSALSFSVDVLDQQTEGSGPSNPRTRGTISASYSRAITKDWAMNIGYQYERDDQNNFTASSSTAFLTLGRRFTLKP